MTAATTLFGNSSFLHSIADNSSALIPGQILPVLCQNGIPFSRVGLGDEGHPHKTRCKLSPKDLRDKDDHEELVATQLNNVVASWLSFFGDPDRAEYMLLITTFLANRAVLRMAATGAGMEGKKIYYSSGTMFNKPSKSIASTVIISALILLEVVALAALVRYVNSVPTWTSSLDAMAIASIARAMGEGEIPPIGPFSDMDRDRLRGVDALIGLVDQDTGNGGCDTPRGSTEERKQDQPGLDRPLLDSDSERGATTSGIRFGLGARGIVFIDSVPEKRALLPTRKRKKRTDEEGQ
ncbi:hypothetical protein IMZ48_31445 [Candidatus Bathyarchaeota archaeon]|nr:hypothetical protein [Candidatus Bathyarchaeota archaeon]